MFETAELGRKVSKQAYETVVPGCNSTSVSVTGILSAFPTAGLVGEPRFG